MSKSLARLMLIGIVFTGLYLGVSRVFAWDLDGEMHQLARSVVHEMRRANALYQRQIEMEEVMELKQAATEEFLAGRLTLRETAEQFHAADALVQNDPDGLVAKYWSPRTKQGMYRQIEIWIEGVLLDRASSSEAEKVRGRLHEELKAFYPSASHVVD